MIIVIQEINGKPFTENSIISIPADIWIPAGRKLMENGTISVEKMMAQRKHTGRKCMENITGLEMTVL